MLVTVTKLGHETKIFKRQGLNILPFTVVSIDG